MRRDDHMLMTSEQLMNTNKHQNYFNTSCSHLLPSLWYSELARIMWEDVSSRGLTIFLCLHNLHDLWWWLWCVREEWTVDVSLLSACFRYFLYDSDSVRAERWVPSQLEYWINVITLEKIILQAFNTTIILDLDTALHICTICKRKY